MRCILVLLAVGLSASPAIFNSASASEMIVPAANGAGVILTLPKGWTAVQAETKTVIATPERTPYIQIWQVTTAATAPMAATMVTSIVTSEVTAFQAAKNEALEIAGSPAQRLTGTGTETDDGDPSNAEVTFFAVGGKVFVCVAHGEGPGAATHSAALATMLATAKPVSP